jgi:hypothetical protein
MTPIYIYTKTKVKILIYEIRAFKKKIKRIGYSGFFFLAHY